MAERGTDAATEVVSKETEMKELIEKIQREWPAIRERMIADIERQCREEEERREPFPGELK